VPAAGAIEIGGMIGTLVLLVPVLVLAIAMLRASRTAPPEKTRTSAPLRAIPEGALSETVPAGPARVPDVLTEKALDERIREAEAAGDTRALAGLYLASAREARENGSSDEAANRLRASIRASATGKDRQTQAEARLELADIAREAGDLTTACEHWQIARALFHEDARKGEVFATETLMRRHGCPTDWILNDF